MKAWLLDSLGGLSKLRLGEIPDPQPQADEVVLRVLYAALNPADRYMTEGQYPARPALPHILGRDGIGVVESVGKRVATSRGDVKIGDKLIIVRSEVGITRHGTFAQKVAVPVESLLPPPPGWSDEESAGATLVYLTAWQALTMWGELAPNSVVLITGASGGVGCACVQLAAAMGHTVIGLSRDPAKASKLIQQGASLTLDPNDTQWRRTLKAALDNRRVDLVIDNVGGALFNDVIDSLGYNGKVSCVGRLAGPVPQFNTASLFFRRIRIGGVQVGDCTPEQSRNNWHSVLSLLQPKGTRPLIDSIHPFDQLIPAFQRLAEGPMGKVLLKVGS